MALLAIQWWGAGIMAIACLAFVATFKEKL